MIKHIGAGLVALSLLLSVGAMAAPAQAASLTSAQISAIVGLLQSFGADQATINNVSIALGGSTTNSTLSCSSFSDVHYGQFDNDAGGRVSQLQTWLGIPSTSFGFGTYGNKTKTAWQAKCGGTQTTPSTSNALSATPASGAVPLTVNFTITSPVPNEKLNFGDGNQQFYGLSGYCSSALLGKPCVVTHTYTNAGTYSPYLISVSCSDGGYCSEVGNALGTATITVTGSNTTQPSVLNVTPTSGSAPLTVTFSNLPTFCSKEVDLILEMDPTERVTDLMDRGQSQVLHTLILRQARTLLTRTAPALQEHCLEVL